MNGKQSDPEITFRAARTTAIGREWIMLLHAGLIPMENFDGDEITMNQYISIVYEPREHPDPPDSALPACDCSAKECGSHITASEIGSASRSNGFWDLVIAGMPKKPDKTCLACQQYKQAKKCMKDVLKREIAKVGTVHA